MIPTIGLEIHCELKTKQKMFCSCLNDPDETHPNINICPICLGHPGTLPTINKEAVLAMIKIGLALNGKIATKTHFDRKSYFYPDLPKGYQISQYEEPIVQGGKLLNKRIRRVHLEEDTGRLLHTSNGSLVDFNRAGVPLMELVTEPDFHSAEEVLEFAKELQMILRYLDVSNADMEKGELRVEANVSLDMGVKTELKNINSFKSVYDAVNFEIQRQKEVLQSGGKIIQETRGWDEKLKKTVVQRLKESAHDYRYFPEPDLPPLNLQVFDIQKMKNELPELPAQKRERFQNEYGLNLTTINLLIEDKKFADFFEHSVSELNILTKNKFDYTILVNYLLSDVKGLMNELAIQSVDDFLMSPENFAHLIYLIIDGKLSSRLAKNILLEMMKTGQDPEIIMKSQNLNLINDNSKLEEIIKQIINQNPKAVDDYKKGKNNALQFLIGQIMAQTKGQANPEKLQELIKKFI
ncbi:MAG: Asp-tRNA(Asn)/Glu-tRNA(Gln) amidotransferase subunit GatB [Minisyncoccia bacterium]